MTSGAATAPPGPECGGRAGRGGFGLVLRAEWTKFRTVRGWVIGVIVAPLVTVGLGYLVSSGITCSQGPHPCSAPVGPGAESVTDSFYFVRRPLAGNGSITVRVTSLADTAGAGSTATAGLQPWSKAGILIKAGTRPGSAYAAILVTGTHGVRMQYDFTGDTAGLPGAVSPASPRWLRLTRSGSALTGYDSVDGNHWVKVGTVGLPGLPATVQAGLFAVATPLLPAAAADWLLRVTPAAAFAVQGTSVRYSQVSNAYLPFFGYYPLGPWAGFAVLCGYAGLALALAAVLLRRRDA
jgi:hypothetical protein